jgi:hypothetical protein
VTAATNAALAMTASQLVDAATLITLAKEVSPAERAQQLAGAKQLIKQARQGIERIERADLAQRVPA